MDCDASSDDESKPHDGLQDVLRATVPSGSGHPGVHQYRTRRDALITALLDAHGQSVDLEDAVNGDTEVAIAPEGGQ